MKLLWHGAGLLLVAGALMAQDPPSRVARLNLIDGAVSFQPASMDEWTAATLNYPLTAGDHLYSDQGARAEMHIGPNAVRLAAQTNFGFLNLDDRTVQMRLTEGAIIVRVRSLSDDDVYEVDTPNGAISLLRTGEYRIDTDPNRNATMVTVRAGEAEVTANGQSFPVHARQTGYFSGNGVEQNVLDANPPDEFDQFSSIRDQREDSVPPPRYVSRDMVGYEDLDANGTWTTVPDYGPVWRPRVPVGWVPYRDGHWAWVEPWGWTWIDSAPWGFAPFHYGRWAYVGGGWGWCPGPVVVRRPVYAPALVAFVGGSNWGVSLRLGGGGVGWFPLGPREPYFPAYHVSNNYIRQVNVTNVNVTNVTNIRNVTYVNQRVPGAVVAISRQDFVTARQIGRNAIAVPPSAVASEPVMGNAPVAPQRESVMARGDSRYVPRPRADFANRPVIARSTPPPAPVAFAAKEQALAANPGQPVDAATMRSLRQSQAVVNRPVVQQAVETGQTARPGTFGRANGGFNQPQNAPVQTQQNYPAQQDNRPQVQDRYSTRPPSAAPRPDQNTRQDQNDRLPVIRPDRRIQDSRPDVQPTRPVQPERSFPRDRPVFQDRPQVQPARPAQPERPVMQDRPQVQPVRPAPQERQAAPPDRPQVQAVRPAPQDRPQAAPREQHMEQRQNRQPERREPPKAEAPKQ